MCTLKVFFPHVATYVESVTVIGFVVQETAFSKSVVEVKKLT